MEVRLMRARIVLFTFALTILAFAPAQATEPDLEIATVSVVDCSVVVLVHNDDAEADSARITMSVELADGSSQVLTSPTITVEGESTVAVTFVAAERIVAIGDGPEPIQP
jgi:hypothetical protein